MALSKSNDKAAIAAAMKEGRARGLPEGWSVKFDGRRRRKWVSPGPIVRTYDSLPKALARVERDRLAAGGGGSAGMAAATGGSNDGGDGTGAATPNSSSGSGSGGGSGCKRKRGQPGGSGGGKGGGEGFGGIGGGAMKHAPAGPPAKKSTTSYGRGGGRTRRASPPKVRYPEDEPLMDEDDDAEPESESDAETALDAPPQSEYDMAAAAGGSPGADAAGGGGEEGGQRRTRATTVHWDPLSPEGRKVGFRIRIFDDVNEEWRPGRVILYEPNSNRHKIEYDDTIAGEVRWLRLQNEIIQCGSRLVWALVKGFAWWPAQVMECNPPTQTTNKEGYVYVEFFGADQVATIREAPELIRPFNNGEVDNVIRKSKKKRNPKAIALARAEQAETRRVRNEAARFYAEKAFVFANRKAGGSLGRRVEFFRSDVNYPTGATVKGTVRQYSATSRKWLISYDYQHKLGTKLDPSWVNLLAKECSRKFLDKEKGKGGNPPTSEDLAPFLFGYSEDNSDGVSSTLDMSTYCSGCMEKFPDESDVVSLICGTCCLAFHPGCLDPPVTVRAAERIMDEGDCWLCPKCRTCRGCQRLDIGFGTRMVQLRPPTLFLPPGETLELCSACSPLYDQDRYCPDCGHTWDDAKYQRTQRILRWQGKTKKPSSSVGGSSKRRKKDGGGAVVGGSVAAALTPGSEDRNVAKGDASAADGDATAFAAPEPSWYHPESTVWGFNEGAMLICDSCNLWVHAGCAGLSREEYEDTNRGVHPIFSKEFLCRMCCISRCKFLIQALQKEDSMLLFAMPVTEQMAPTYRDVIKAPMDLQTMMERTEAGLYHNYAWIRDSFELMVSNALTFNVPGTKYWTEAKRYYEACINNVFDRYGKAAPPGLHHSAVHKAFADAERAREMEAERVQKDETAEKKDLVAGAHVKSVELSPLAAASDPESCVEYADLRLLPVEAFYCAWMECCFVCGSSGASDTMLFCVDCGEAYHSFCSGAPILSMTDWAVSGWRCPNCKICEITGDVPEDENMMLFCEMCDRAFTLTELSPPLKSVPNGLFICGQCVDCKSCGNRGGKEKASVKYWSRDPQKCFRCGGCKGLVERETKGMKCVVCSKLWRSNDTDLVPCVKCKRSVHAACDKRARDILQNKEAGEKYVLDHGPEMYQCPVCRRKDDDKALAKLLQKQLRDQAYHVLVQGHNLVPGNRWHLDELHIKLFNNVDWQMRELWKEEYQNIVLEGERLLEAAKKKHGAKLHDIFNSDGKGPEAPDWMVKRASRWVRYKGLVKADRSSDIRAIVLRAKMAAAFINICAKKDGVSLRKLIKFPDRLKSLLISPSEETGTTQLPAEKIRTTGNNDIIHEQEWSTKHFDKETFDSLLQKETPQGQSSTEEAAKSLALGGFNGHCNGQGKLSSSPIRGWGGIDESVQQIRPWKDPRSCCLCGGCGDDDAGVPGYDSIPSGEEVHAMTDAKGAGASLAVAGRLLPMQQGLWVHSACALWSSEVWENPADGLLYALDKARYRGSKLKCFGCGRPGATIGCQKPNCSFNYHFPCAKACGAVYTKEQQIFCKNHKASATSVVDNISFEVMKPLKAAAEQESEECVGKALCYRVGSLIIHTFGTVEQDHDGFHSEQYITPSGYTATRIFWSFSAPRKRMVYFLRVECCGQKPIFSITAADAPHAPIKGQTIEHAYNELLGRVEKANISAFSLVGDHFSTLPSKRVCRKGSFGRNAPHFFGFGLSHVRKVLETLPGIAAVAVPLSPSSKPYLFCFKHPSEEDIMDLQRKRAVKAAEKALQNASGCARTEGMCAVAKSGGSGRITRALVKNADEVRPESTGDATWKGRNMSEPRSDVDSNIQVKYREMKSVPMEARLEAKRSHIHGWGLFTKNDLPKHSMVVEYMGETIRQRVADKREIAYETSGVGSCYMFRLDHQRIVDATMIGCMARFMNHCCQPNAYAKVISVNTEQGIDKKIVVFANRAIKAGEEITYDYKFPVEDGSLKCTCGAPNCIGRMN